MAWTTPVDQTTGTLITASIYNAQIIDNLAYLHGDAGVTIDVSAGGQPFAANNLITYAPAGFNAYRNFLTSSDANPAFRILGSGALVWGAGGANPLDTTLTRNSAGILQIGTSSQSGTLALFGSAAAANAVETFVTTEAQARWAVTADGTTSWGAGGSSARDTTLARTGASTLRIANGAGASGGVLNMPGGFITSDSTTGLSIGSGSKLGFYGATPILTPSAAGTATGYTAGTTAATFHSDDKYTGNVGTTGYTVNGIVAALKNLGLLIT